MYVLVGGWPASGKSTVARALGRELDLAYLGKDEVKEALMDALGAPSTVEQSKTLGVAAVHAVLRVARDCPGAVIDSTWYDYSAPLVEQLPGPLVEVRCLADRETVRARYRSRVRDARHLDGARTEEELWARAVAPLGVGPLVEVDTTRSVDIVSLADRIRSVVRT
jgi:predicted kinase